MPPATRPRYKSTLDCKLACALEPNNSMYSTHISISTDLTHRHSSYDAHLLLERVQDAVNEQLLQARIDVRRAQVLHHLQGGTKQQNKALRQGRQPPRTDQSQHLASKVLAFFCSLSDVGAALS